MDLVSIGWPASRGWGSRWDGNYMVVNCVCDWKVYDCEGCEDKVEE